MFGWNFMLILQSFLIRTNRRDIHRLMGKLAYVLGPLVILTTLVLANYRLNFRGLTAEGVFLLIGSSAWASFAAWYKLLPIS